MSDLFTSPAVLALLHPRALRDFPASVGSALDELQADQEEADRAEVYTQRYARPHNYAYGPPKRTKLKVSAHAARKDCRESDFFLHTVTNVTIVMIVFQFTRHGPKWTHVLPNPQKESRASIAQYWSDRAAKARRQEEIRAEWSQARLDGTTDHLHAQVWAIQSYRRQQQELRIRAKKLKGTRHEHSPHTPAADAYLKRLSDFLIVDRPSPDVLPDILKSTAETGAQAMQVSEVPAAGSVGTADLDHLVLPTPEEGAERTEQRAPRTRSRTRAEARQTRSRTRGRQRE